MSASRRPTGKIRGLGRDQVDDGRAALRVRRGGDDARRLVEQVVHQPGLHADLGTVDLDHVGLGIDPATEDRPLAVHPHAPPLDQLLAHPPAAEPGLGQHLLQADPVALLLALGGRAALGGDH